MLQYELQENLSEAKKRGRFSDFPRIAASLAIQGAAGLLHSRGVCNDS